VLGAHISCFKSAFYDWLRTLTLAKILGPGSHLKTWTNRTNRTNLCLFKTQKIHRLSLPLLNASLLQLTGCPRYTTARQNTYIRRQYMNNRITRATQTIGNHQKPISDDTVRRWLITSTIRCRCLTKRPILTVHHRHEHLQWPTQSQNWRHLAVDEKNSYILQFHRRWQKQRRCER
jgi:hypothetical protein